MKIRSALTRCLRHMFTTGFAVRRAFPKPTLEAIQASIASGEKIHRAQVRLAIEPALALPDLLHGMSARQRARDLFAHYRIWDTEENCGILIYINLADHKVEILADRAVGRALGANEWRQICNTMTQGFSEGKFHESTLAGLQQLNNLLGTNFPSSGSTSNELSNRPLIL